MAFKYSSYDHYYDISQLDEFLDEVGELEIIDKNNSLSYFNVPAAFDIETTSTEYNGAKFATMYIWQFGINGVSIYGRTWVQFSRLMDRIVKHFHIHQKRRLVVYVHNLAYEFQFMRERIKWAKDRDGKNVVFSLKKRRPIYALSDSGIEFRCSYFLSNCPLAYIGSKMLFKYPVQKMTGDLDYNIIRHSETPLTMAELGYCLNDIRVVMSFIQEKIENEGNIANIPLTNTGYVRKFTRDYCMGTFIDDPFLSKKQRYNYQDIMHALRIQSAKEYEQLKLAFAGGFTHASPTKSRWGCKENGKQLSYWKDVGSADLASSYPYTMVSSYFPMSSGTFLGKVKYPEQFSQLINNFCCLFTVTFYDIYQIFPYESYISVSKCTSISDDRIVQNGRLVEASYCTINVTELDFDIISNVYSWSEIEVDNMRVYKRGYLPKVFIESILSLYEAKTTLKGVADRYVEYMVKKGMLNSTYGMAVTDIVRDDAIYNNGEWESIEADAFSQLSGYNKAYTRFLFYPWGVWVTAHARHNLWEAILEFGEDYIYADTDSIKGLNFDKHSQFFKRYNVTARKKLFLMCDFYGIDKSLVQPKNSNGEEQLIGVWDREKDYVKFRTIGAKRYLYEYKSGELGMTVSGVNKRYALPYLIHKYCNIDYDLCRMAYNEDPRYEEQRKEALSQLIQLVHQSPKGYDDIFDNFDDSLIIPPGFSGKSIHTYVDMPFAAYVTDYTGNEKLCYEKSYTHLEPTGYVFNMAEEYLNYLNGGTTTEFE